MYEIGILAYGSLINNPGQELEPLIINKLECVTPFKVEYARKSRKRGYGPTLIPYEAKGRKVKAQVLILKNDTVLEDAISMLYRREIGTTDRSKKYQPKANLTRNTTQVEIIENFLGVKKILFTKLGCNLDDGFTEDTLANLAIESILSDAGKEERDGCRYLLQNINNGIITEYTEQYLQAILMKTGSNTLEESIYKLDKQRKT